MRTLFTAVRGLIYATGFIFLWGWVALRLRLMDVYFGQLPEPLQPVGIVLMALGAIVALACVGTFILRGQGTPAPFDAPRVFVATGPYRYVRNPMYTGAVAFLAGYGFYSGSTSILLFAPLWFALAHVFVVLYEEPALLGRFDGAYVDYCKRVSRWMPHRPGADGYK